MHSGFFGHAADAKERLAFAPPSQPGLVRAFALAVIAHLLLLLALMHGLQWKRETQTAAAEAELWSAVPQQAAPREVVPPPPPPPPPAPVVQAPPRPEPPPVVKAPEPPPQRDADIALEREKQKRELQKKKLAEERALEKKLQAQEEREERRRLEAQKKREQELARKEDEARRKQAEAKREKAQLAEAKRKEEDRRRREEQDAKAREQSRAAAIQRSLAMAGTGGPTSAGTAARSSGPSANWGGKVQDIVMPKITFVRETSAKWVTDVEVRLAPNGTILSRRVVKSSGSREWDDAVLAALDKAERLPPDTDGRVPTPVVIGFRPQR